LPPLLRLPSPLWSVPSVLVSVDPLEDKEEAPSCI
jgi:hypothetical protein